ncbi:MAG: hypothetical protein WC615_11170 [Mucilaginibacter sp.]|jgi:hypothetical protein|uniref:hypothetical protein n=1 Tax=Mucilaginibacter sp. TaxID=1882438 RepID=UPI0035691055
MNDIPATVGNARVIYYAVVNLLDSNVYEGRKQIAGFIICQSGNEQGYYLFSCDTNWKEFADTWHESIDDAINQAEYECNGISNLFQKVI